MNAKLNHIIQVIKAPSTFKVVEIFTRGNRHPPRQPVTVRLVGVVQPEVVVGSRKSVRELNGVADVSRRYGRVRLREPVRWVVVEPIESILLLVHISDFYHEVSTKAVLQQSRKWENYESASQHNSQLWKMFQWLGTFWNRTNEQTIVFQTATREKLGNT